MAKKTRKKKKNDSVLLTESVVNGIQEKKGREIVVLDLRKIENAVSDFFIICEADSTTQVGAIARSVQEVVEKERGEKAWHSEGVQNAQWILIDYVSVVVHVFQKEIRQFYNLESLWADAEIMEVELQY